MKHLYLYQILKNISGSLVRGNINTIIKDAASGLWGIVGDNTMYIHLNRNKLENIEPFCRYGNIVVVTQNPEEFHNLPSDSSLIKVDDINKFYWRFVDYYRSLFNIPVIGITGTCGKTTTTEMIKHILSKRYKVHSTRKGNNSTNFDFSYLLGIDDNTEAAVFEMGVAAPGNLRYSCRHFKPQIRILLNIGVYHLLGCGTLENYIKAKAELIEDLDPVSGTLIINADDENIKKIDMTRFQRITSFGLSENTNFRAQDIKDSDDGIIFTLCHDKKNYAVYVPGFGRHNAYNALAAIAAVCNLGITIEEAVEYLKSYKPMIRHLQLREGPKGSLIIDDNWNNTPPSMESALQVLKDVSGLKRKIAVLGYMYNLGIGALAQDEYRRMGEKVMQAGVDILIVIEKKPLEIAWRALELGMDNNKVIFINSGSEVLDTLTPYFDKNTVILLKAPDDKVNL